MHYVASGGLFKIIINKCKKIMVKHKKQIPMCRILRSTKPANDWVDIAEIKCAFNMNIGDFQSWCKMFASSAIVQSIYLKKIQWKQDDLWWKRQMCTEKPNLLCDPSNFQQKIYKTWKVTLA